MKTLFIPNNSCEWQAYFNWKDYENDKTDLLFCYGTDAGYTMDQPKNFKYNFYYELDEPNAFIKGKLPHEREKWDIDNRITNGKTTWDINFWTKILHICPYTAKWENEVYGVDKFVPVNLYFDPKYNMTNEKIYDVCYVGGLHTHNPGNIILDLVGEISTIPNYRIVSYSDHPLVTDHHVSFSEKLNINSKSKISIVTNLLHDTSTAAEVNRNISQIPNYKNNEAFKMLKYGLMPQIKNRILEAAATKSLVLVLYDHWNVIEQYFTPDVHFIYFNQGELKETVDECLSNWDYCEKIIDNMHTHYMNNYTMEKTYEKFLKSYDT